MDRELRIERLKDDMTCAAASLRSTFSYRGAFAERFYMKIKAADLPDVYCAAFYRSGEAVSRATNGLDCISVTRPGR